MNDDFERYIDNTATGFYDLIVFCKVNGMRASLLDYAKAVAPTWYWFMDPMSTAKAIDATYYAQNATFASATASDVAERFKLINNNAYHLIEGFDPDLYYPEDLKKIHDIVFIGNYTSVRYNQIISLRTLGHQITVFGNGWEDANITPVYGEDERIEMNQAKWVLNFCQDDIIFSDRIVKALACGANIISSECEDLKRSTWYSGMQQLKTFSSLGEFDTIISNSTASEGFEKITAGTMKEYFSWKSVCAVDILERVKEWREKQ
ncbi:MAG: hypothetical protein GY718_18225 [Lentisphaerae bacterium]|nr:hypothetical protein [Lentisphaerota bacterium]